MSRTQRIHKRRVLGSTLATSLVGLLCLSTTPALVAQASPESNNFSSEDIFADPERQALNLNLTSDKRLPYATDVLSLDQALVFARSNNHKMLNLVDQLALSELDYDSARAVYRTRFGTAFSSNARVGAEVGSAYSTYMSKENESGSRYGIGLYNSTFGDQSLSEWRFSYTLPFFRNPLDDNKLRIIQAEMGAARSQRLMEIGQEELENQVVSAYLRLAMATKAQAIAKGDNAVAQSIYSALEIRESNGELSRLELSEARLQVLEARQAEDLAGIDVENQKDRFRLLLGMDPYQDFNVDSDMLDLPIKSLLDRPQEELELHAMTHRTELLAKKEELTMTRHRINSTKTGALPPMEVSLNYSLIGEGEGPFDSFNIDDQRFGVGVRMNTDIANSEHKNKQRKLYLRKKSQQREYEHLQASITAEVRGAYGVARRYRTALDYAQEYVSIAEMEHQQNEILLRRGELTELELLESEQTLSKARQRALGAKVDYLLSEQSLAVTSGIRSLP